MTHDDKALLLALLKHPGSTHAELAKHVGRTGYAMTVSRAIDRINRTSSSPLIMCDVGRCVLTETGMAVAQNIEGGLA